MTILRRIAYLRLAELWSLPHLTGEASPTSPIGSLWSHGVTRTANTPQVGVHRFTKRWSLPYESHRTPVVTRGNENCEHATSRCPGGPRTKVIKVR